MPVSPPALSSEPQAQYRSSPFETHQAGGSQTEIFAAPTDGYYASEQAGGEKMYTGHEMKEKKKNEKSESIGMLVAAGAGGVESEEEEEKKEEDEEKRYE